VIERLNNCVVSDSVNARWRAYGTFSWSEHLARL
jgi:hypothetical protein